MATQTSIGSNQKKNRHISPYVHTFQLQDKILVPLAGPKRRRPKRRQQRATADCWSISTPETMRSLLSQDTNVTKSRIVHNASLDGEAPSGAIANTDHVAKESASDGSRIAPVTMSNTQWIPFAPTLCGFHTSASSSSATTSLDYPGITLGHTNTCGAEIPFVEEPSVFSRTGADAPTNDTFLPINTTTHYESAAMPDFSSSSAISNGSSGVSSTPFDGLLGVFGEPPAALPGPYVGAYGQYAMYHSLANPTVINAGLASDWSDRLEPFHELRSTDHARFISVTDAPPNSTCFGTDIPFIQWKTRL
ncbi:unnamed protein product [Peniophora sp. CBMAI 1063]|nr:unnamed protein product [Peniophora sp. CBMAI 1063]